MEYHSSSPELGRKDEEQKHNGDRSGSEDDVALHGNAARLQELGMGQQQPTSGAFLSETLGTPIDLPSDHAIPKKLHRFWSGGPLSDQAMAILRESTEKTKGTDWSHTLWYSSHLETAMAKEELVDVEAQQKRTTQREELGELGYQVRDIAELAEEDPKPLNLLDRMFRKKQPERRHGKLRKSDLEIMGGKAAARVQKGGEDKWDDVKHLSDLARLMYLHEEGGHHFDVDMGLGDMDFDRQYYHNDPDGQVPLMGSLTATTTDEYVGPLLDGLGPKEGRDLRSGNHARDLARHASDMSQMLNGMIATQPNNPRFADAIEELRNDAVHPDASLSSGMVQNPTLLFGPKMDSLSPEDKQTARNQTVPPYLFDLQHLTPESDNR